MATEIAIEIDGPLVVVQAKGDGGVFAHLGLSSATRVEGLRHGRVLYRLDGERFAVGEPGSFVPSKASCNDTKEGMAVRLHDAMLRVQRSLPGRDVRLITVRAFAEKPDFAEQRDHLDSVVMRIPEPADLVVEKAWAIPRGLSAGVDSASFSESPGSATIVDIGASQTWIIRFRDDDEGTVDPSATRAIPMGWLDVAKRVEATLTSRHGIQSIQPGAVVSLMSEGAYRLRGDRVRADQILGEATEVLAREIQSVLTEVGGDDAIVVVGLSALHLAAHLDNNLGGRQVRVPDAPAFANVRGALGLVAPLTRNAQQTGNAAA